MSAGQWIEGITQLGLIVLYTIVFGMAISTRQHAKYLARQRSATIIAAIALIWLSFYTLFTHIWPFVMLHTSVYWSRMFQYATGSGLLWLVLLIRYSETIEAVWEAEARAQQNGMLLEHRKVMARATAVEAREKVRGD